jgi:Uma2 family endonuclease
MAKSGIFEEDDRVELIEGEIVEMTPIGSQHWGHVERLNWLLSQKLDLREVIIATQNSVTLSPYSEPEPDIAVVRFREDFYTIRHPSPDEILLIIEVADSSLEYDRLIKMPVYAHAQVPEAWIVNLSDRVIEVFRDPTDSGYKSSFIAQSDEVLSPLRLPFLQIKPTDILLPRESAS